ncbi:MAG: type I restriction enzyme HsdR N-terminal domain-containing protein [Candidatus Dadabacteria bacterium]
MLEVQFPKAQFRIKKKEGKDFIFDTIRKKWLVLTDEEWVRQNFVAYLVITLHYPSSVIAIEKEIHLNDLKKRFDILVYNQDHKPWLMVECKAPSIPLNEEALQQLLRYNLSVPVTYLVISNGNVTMGWEKDSTGITLLQQLPVWK